MLRGIDKREIFLKENDYGKFLHYIDLAKEKSETVASVRHLEKVRGIGRNII